MVRTTTEAATPEELAAEYADDLSQENLNDVAIAAGAEYSRDGHDPVDDVGILTPIGLSVRLCADALGFDAGSMIDFDGADEITVEYDTFDQDDPHATPIELVRLAAQADDAADRNVRFRDGAGSVRVYVDVPERRDD